MVNRECLWLRWVYLRTFILYMYVYIRACVSVCERDRECVYIIRFVLGCPGMKKEGKTTVLSNALHSDGLACSFCARRLSHTILRRLAPPPPRRGGTDTLLFKSTRKSISLPLYDHRPNKKVFEINYYSSLDSDNKKKYIYILFFLLLLLWSNRERILLYL